MYEVILTPRAQKELKRLPKRYQRAIVLSLHELREYPFSGKPLTRELTGQFSLRVGVYRILYKINKQNKIVSVLTIGHRSTVYQ